MLHRAQCDRSLHRLYSGILLYKGPGTGLCRKGSVPVTSAPQALLSGGTESPSQLFDGDLQPWHPCPCSFIMSRCTWSGLQLVSLAQPRRRKIPNLRRLQRKTKQSQRRVRAESGVTMLWAVVGRGRGQLRLLLGHWPDTCPAERLHKSIKCPLKSEPHEVANFSLLVEGYRDRIFE